MIDETEDKGDMNGPESFADLLGDEPVQAKRLVSGQQLKTTVVGITKDAVFLDLGAKSEGYIRIQELEDSDGTLKVQVGDTVIAYFLSERDNEMLFTTMVGSGPVNLGLMEDAWRNGIPVEGQVEKETKGGFAVQVSGGIRGFCPFSQMELKRIAAPADYIGQRLTFRIIEFKEGGKNIILSRRAVLEAEREKLKAALKETLKEGMRVRGAVSSIQSYGAFVDIGGMEGLIPISEMAWGRVEDVHGILSEGQEVDMVVLKLDWEKDRLSFSLKGALSDPWEGIEQRYTEGSWKRGVVSRLATFGAFVTLEPGIDGLVHISELGAGRRINHPREVLATGQEVEVRIVSVDKANKRLSLSLAADKGEEEKEERRENQQAMARLQQESSGRGFGSLGDLLKAKSGSRMKK